MNMNSLQEFYVNNKNKDIIHGEEDNGLDPNDESRVIDDRNINIKQKRKRY